MSTAPTDPTLTHGVLDAQQEGSLVLALPGTDYRLRLRLAPAPAAPLPAPGQRLRGTIRARARRVDVVHTGGRFIEPVAGRPRRIQGRVAAVNDADGTIAVQAAPRCVLVCTLTDPRQRPGHFAPGQLVGFDAEPGATFVPIIF